MLVGDVADVGSLERYLPGGSRPPGASTPRSRRRRARWRRTTGSRTRSRQSTRWTPRLGADDVAVPARGQPAAGSPAPAVGPGDLAERVARPPRRGRRRLSPTGGAWVPSSMPPGETRSTQRPSRCITASAGRHCGRAAARPRPGGAAPVFRPGWHRPSTASLRRRRSGWTSTHPLLPADGGSLTDILGQHHGGETPVSSSHEEFTCRPMTSPEICSTTTGSVPPGCSARPVSIGRCVSASAVRSGAGRPRWSGRCASCCATTCHWWW